MEGEPNDESQDASLDVRFDDSEGAFCDMDPPPSVWGRTSSAGWLCMCDEACALTQCDELCPLTQCDEPCPLTQCPLTQCQTLLAAHVANLKHSSLNPRLTCTMMMHA